MILNLLSQEGGIFFQVFFDFLLCFVAFSSFLYLQEFYSFSCCYRESCVLLYPV